MDRLPTVHARSNEGRGHPATPLIDRRTRGEVRQRLFLMELAHERKDRDGRCRTDTPGTARLDRQPRLIAQSAFLSGRPDARIDI